MNDADSERIVSLARAAFTERAARAAALRRDAWSLRARLTRCLARCRANLRRWLIPTGSRRAYLWVSLRSRASANPSAATVRPVPPNLESDYAAYARWIALNEPVAVKACTTLVSVCVLLEEVEPLHLAAFLESLLRQSHQRWECCLVATTVPPLLAWYAARDNRIRLVLDSEPTLRAALAVARGEFVTFAGCGDELAPQALALLTQTAQQYPEAGLIYADEDHLDGNERCAPVFKPAWSASALRHVNYIGRPALLRRSLAHTDSEHALWRDLATDLTPVVHLPCVLYHRRRAEPTQPVVLTATLTQRPLVSIVIPNKDSVPLLRTCIEGIHRSTYKQYEIILVENNSRDAATFAYYDELAAQPDCQVVRWEGPFNFAAINNEAVRHASGDILLFLNNDIEIRQHDWLERLLELALEPDVGAVAPQLLYPDGTIQHAGIVLGIDDQCGHWQRFTPGNAPGYAGSLQMVRPWCAVTAACLMMRRTVFAAVGGFDEQFAVTFNDIDLCLRVHQRHWAILCTPQVQLIHHESQTRGLDYLWRNRARLRDEVERFRRRWAALLRAGDPFFNPNLSLLDEYVRLELRGCIAATPRLVVPQRRAVTEEENQSGVINHCKTALPLSGSSSHFR